MNATELAPLVYTEWPNTDERFDPETCTFGPPADFPTEDWNNRPVVDDIFKFAQTIQVYLVQSLANCLYPV
jgi:hypothetical protein